MKSFSKFDIPNIVRKTGFSDAGVLTQVNKPLLIDAPKLSNPEKISKNIKFNSLFVFDKKLSFGSVKKFSFVALCLMALVMSLQFSGLIVKTQKSVLGQASDIYSEVEKISADFSPNGMAHTDNSLELIAEKFFDISQRIENLGPLVNRLPLGSSAKNLSIAAYQITQAGKLLLESFDVFTRSEILPRNDEGLLDSSFYEKNQVSYQKNLEILDLLNKAEKNLASSESMPGEYRTMLDYMHDQLLSVKPVFERYVKIQKLYLELFNKSKTYFLAFQNSDELRPTGGFIGTYGVLNTYNGELKNLKIDSIYNLDSKIYTQIAAPGPLQPDIARWGIRDANWFISAPESAKKILYFYEQGEQTADGVIFFTPQVFEKMLRITGPIYLPEYDVEVNEGNFQSIVQFQTSVAYDPALRQPKKFLADFAEIVLAKLEKSELDTKISIIDLFSQSFLTKEMAVYSTNEETQKLIEQLNWANSVKPTTKDYLMLTTSNFGGTKSDRKISRSVNLNTKIFGDGSVLNNLQITFNSTSAQDNKSFVRILVPKNSTLLSAKGFADIEQKRSEAIGLNTDSDLQKWDISFEEIDSVKVRSQLDKQEFTGWVNIPSGRSVVLSLSYVVSIDARDHYSILIQPQAGSQLLTFKQNVNYQDKKVKWNNSLYRTQDGLLTLEAVISQDQKFDILFHR